MGSWVLQCVGNDTLRHRAIIKWAQNRALAIHKLMDHIQLLMYYIWL